MPNAVYNSTKADLLRADVDYVDDTINVALVTSAYSPDVDGDSFYSDLTNEVTGTGYTAGGAEITTKTVTQDDTNDVGVFDGDDVVWASSTITARGAVIYKDTGVAGTSNLICYVDFGVDKSSSSADFTIQWNSAGIINIT